MRLFAVVYVSQHTEKPWIFTFFVDQLFRQLQSLLFVILANETINTLLV